MASFIWILICWISITAIAIPIHPNKQFSKKSDEDSSVLWTSIKRQTNKTDLIRPSLCPSPCNRLFKAQRVEKPVLGMDDREPSEEELCYCRCPTESPIFLQSIGQCVSKIDGCKRPIKIFNTLVPVITLPKVDNFIRFPEQILWQESRIKVKQKEGPRCNITHVQVLRENRQWIQANKALFELGWSNELNVAGLLWNGTNDEREGLLGTLIKIQMDCIGAESNAHCLTLRISGELISPNYSEPLFVNGAQNRVETVVIILLAILLFFTSFGYLILWKVRWRIKKSKLISTLQMQFLYHLKQEKEKVNEAAHHHYQVFGNGGQPQMYPHKSPMYSINNLTTFEGQTDMTLPGMMSESQMQSNATLIAKRKLYFSAEFFEPHLMQNPPPMAIHFLEDLRKMIDIAKQRINMRKHVQHLGPIEEEPHEIYQSYMRERSNAPLTVTSVELNKSRQEESSPKSIKSVDSGHESATSNENSQDSKKDEPSENDSYISTTRHQFKGPLHKNGENTLTPTSRIPTMNGINLGQKSPRPVARMLSVANQETPPALPPRNPSTTSPKIVQQLNGSAVVSQIQPPSRTAETRRKAYAVFPQDAMLKKSLPRRSKKPSSDKTATTNVKNGVIETNM